MAITHVATYNDAPGPNGGTTAGFTTTGVNLLVLTVSWYAGGTTALTVSDSKGNTWIPLTLRNTATIAHRFYYVVNPTVGIGHSVTVSATGIYPVVAWHTFAGAEPVAPFAMENGATATAGSSLAAGSVTPAANGALIVSGWAGMNGTASPTISGLTLTTGVSPIASVCVAGAAAYTIQTTAAPIIPTWSWDGSDHVAASVAVFTAPAAVSAERVDTFTWLPV
jgi:hypothetical protein